MRSLTIACAKSRWSKQWTNEQITFDELCKRLERTIRTSETVEEYEKLPKDKRDNIKDKGGFVGGKLKGVRRKRETLEYRSMLTLDADNTNEGFIEVFEMLFGYESCLYTTHSHTPEGPRVRIIIPLSRDVSAEEYVAISRYLADEIGIDYFDPCSFIISQLMYWPTTSKDGEYVFKRINGVVLDPDRYLKKRPEWKDCSKLPITSKEKQLKNNQNKKQQNPLEKTGVVGAFCNVYSISDAIEAFLSDVYTASAIEDRYDYIPANSTAGLVIYDNDTFAYSNHATDPAYQKELNAFDLVRVHKFPNDDEKKSFDEMSEFAITIKEVKDYLAAEKMEQAEDDFNTKKWVADLEYSKNGKIKATLENFTMIMRKDEMLQGIARNQHSDGIDVKGKLPWKRSKPGWNDTDIDALDLYLSKTYGLYSPTKSKKVTNVVALEREYHPIKEYLSKLSKWDGVKRVDTLLIDYFGAEDNSYTRAVSRKFIAAAVARIYHPGVKFDSVPILNGPQGIGKSTFFAKLAGEWFSDSLTLTDMRDKAGPEKLQGYWILELSELTGMKKADVETVKSFISRVDDKYRASYGVNVENHPRQCVIVGSTNAESGFLRDITGNRRFWPIKATEKGKKKAWDMTKEEVNQIWAEALVIHQNGEKLYLEGEDAKIAEDSQKEAIETDEREGIVREYLNTLLPDNWDKMTVYERRNYLNGSDFGEDVKGTNERKYVCNMEIWCECFGKDSATMKTTDSYAISSIMNKIEGWEKDEKVKRYSAYGVQRGYKKV